MPHERRLADEFFAIGGIAALVSLRQDRPSHRNQNDPAAHLHDRQRNSEERTDVGSHNVRRNGE